MAKITVHGVSAVFCRFCVDSERQEDQVAGSEGILACESGRHSALIPPTSISHIESPSFAIEGIVYSVSYLGLLCRKHARNIAWVSWNVNFN